MTATNSNLQTQYINQQILRRNINIAQSSLYPRLTLNLGGDYSKNRSNLARPFTGPDGSSIDVINTNSLNMTASISLAFTLYNGGQVRNQIKSAKIQEQIGQLQIKDLELTLNNDLLIAYDRYNLRKNLMDIAAENLATSELNLDLGEERYRNGSINSFNYRDLQIVYLQTALSYYQSIYNLIESKTELLRLTGGILSDN